MFYQILFSPQVKRCAIITYKHDIYKLPPQFYSFVLLYPWLSIFSSALSFKLNVFLKDLVTLYNQEYDNQSCALHFCSPFIQTIIRIAP